MSSDTSFDGGFDYYGNIGHSEEDESATSESLWFKQPIVAKSAIGVVTLLGLLLTLKASTAASVIGTVLCFIMFLAVRVLGVHEIMTQDESSGRLSTQARVLSICMVVVAAIAAWNLSKSMVAV